MSEQWTTEKIEKLTSLWQGGWSASQIGEVMRLTRNAVLGKLHRLGLCTRRDEKRAMRAIPPKPMRLFRMHSPTIRSPIITKAREMTKPPPPPPEPPPPRQPITLFDLTPSSCRWPINDGSPQFLFCDGKHIDGSPYCASHTRKAFPNPQRR